MLANEAKVSGIPGYDGVVENGDHCVKLSNEVLRILKIDFKV